MCKKSLVMLTLCFAGTVSIAHGQVPHFNIWSATAEFKELSGLNETVIAEHISVILDLKVEHMGQPWSVIGDLNGIREFDSCSKQAKDGAKMGQIQCETMSTGCPRIDGTWQAKTTAKMSTLPDKEDETNFETVVCECT